MPVSIRSGLMQVPVGISLPAGVTLQAIDGGPNYYSNGGFTKSNSAFTGVSWDDPTFFPIGNFYAGGFITQSDANTVLDLGLNVSVQITNPSTLSLLTNNNIWLHTGTDSSQTNGLEGNRTVGIETSGLNMDEPPDIISIKAVWAKIPNSIQDARVYHVNFTWNQLAFNNLSNDINNPALGTVVMSTVVTQGYPTPNATTRHIDIVSVDKYWFAGSPAATDQSQGAQIYGLGSMTTDQMARGTNYGDMIDIMRGWQAGNFPAPIFQFIENDDGLLTDAGARSITSQEINWAVWGSIIHGCRFIGYFYGGSGGFPGGFDQAIQSGQTISRYNQAKATNLQVKQLARIINAPFALGYVTASPAGYSFPTALLVIQNGIDLMVKYYTGGTYTNALGTFVNGFYIFATTRNSETNTNISATFTITGGAASVTVIGESRSISVSGGQFTDTFANAWTVHIYKVN